jgi:hypothetical protein
VTPDQARKFVARNHRAVMVTRRSGGGLQTSPVTIGIDGDGKVVISSRETAYKVRNLRRRPTATLCVFTDNFFGPGSRSTAPPNSCPCHKPWKGWSTTTVASPVSTPTGTTTGAPWSTSNGSSSD